MLLTTIRAKKAEILRVSRRCKKANKPHLVK